MKPSIGGCNPPPDAPNGDLEAVVTPISLVETDKFSIVPKLFGYVDDNLEVNHRSGFVSTTAEDEVHPQSASIMIENPKLLVREKELQLDCLASNPIETQQIGMGENSSRSPPKSPGRRLYGNARKAKNPVHIQGFRGIRKERRSTRYSPLLSDLRVKEFLHETAAINPHQLPVSIRVPPDRIPIAPTGVVGLMEVEYADQGPNMVLEPEVGSEIQLSQDEGSWDNRQREKGCPVQPIWGTSTTISFADQFKRNGYLQKIPQQLNMVAEQHQGLQGSLRQPHTDQLPDVDGFTRVVKKTIHKPATSSVIPKGQQGNINLVVGGPGTTKQGVSKGGPDKGVQQQKKDMGVGVIKNIAKEPATKGMGKAQANVKKGDSTKVVKPSAQEEVQVSNHFSALDGQENEGNSSEAAVQRGCSINRAMEIDTGRVLPKSLLRGEGTVKGTRNYKLSNAQKSSIMGYIEITKLVPKMVADAWDSEEWEYFADQCQLCSPWFDVLRSFFIYTSGLDLGCIKGGVGYVCLVQFGLIFMCFCSGLNRSVDCLAVWFFSDMYRGWVYLSCKGDSGDKLKGMGCCKLILRRGMSLVDCWILLDHSLDVFQIDSNMGIGIGRLSGGILSWQVGHEAVYNINWLHVFFFWHLCCLGHLLFGSAKNYVGSGEMLLLGSWGCFGLGLGGLLLLLLSGRLTDGLDAAPLQPRIGPLWLGAAILWPGMVMLWPAVACLKTSVDPDWPLVAPLQPPTAPIRPLLCPFGWVAAALGRTGLVVSRPAGFGVRLDGAPMTWWINLWGMGSGPYWEIRDTSINWELSLLYDVVTVGIRMAHAGRVRHGNWLDGDQARGGRWMGMATLMDFELWGMPLKPFLSMVMDLILNCMGIARGRIPKFLVLMYGVSWNLYRKGNHVKVRGVRREKPKCRYSPMLQDLRVRDFIKETTAMLKHKPLSMQEDRFQGQSFYMIFGDMEVDPGLHLSRMPSVIPPFWLRASKILLSLCLLNRPRDLSVRSQFKDSIEARSKGNHLKELKHHHIHTTSAKEPLPNFLELTLDVPA
ncbi:hypothetical protein E3N88_43819 [Mikania micrantha]|uniref:Uncharacterized protein n=1 Tax=Mikania micrantha TaxID=192012 RepID=A0A5N6LDT9_9ASTR|nr:hypothetical protein E3N88_43819 [Mikania micrantha]